MKRIYLDNNATTLLDPTILQHNDIKEILENPSNPSSRHVFGQKAKAFLEKSRLTLAHFLEKSPNQFIFTSGATEAINLAIFGILNKSSKKHIISTKIEHAAIYSTLLYLQNQKSFDITFVDIDAMGAPKLEDVIKAVRDDTALLVFSGANSETGVKIDLEAFSDFAKSQKIPLIVDGVALLGKEKFSIPNGITAMAFSGHKIHAPQGAGFLYVNSLSSINPILFGGPQEHNLRPGTQNLFSIVGLALAIELLKDQDLWIENMKSLRQFFEKSLKEELSFVQVNGLGPKISNTSNISFLGFDSETLLIHLDREKIAASQGSACQAGAVEPSRVLLNMGYPLDRVKSALRFSVSRFTTKEEILTTIEVLKKITKSLKKSIFS